MMYYMDKIRLMMVYVELKIEHLVKLMSRCLKLYKKMDQFIKIFKMIEHIEETEKRNLFDLNLQKRLFVLIQLHLKENPILPVQFIYKNRNVLEELKQDVRSKGVEVKDDPIHSERRGQRYERQSSISGIIINSDSSVTSPRQQSPKKRDRDIVEDESILSQPSISMSMPGDQSTFLIGEKTKGLLTSQDYNESIHTQPENNRSRQLSVQFGQKIEYSDTSEEDNQD